MTQPSTGTTRGPLVFPDPPLSDGVVTLRRFGSGDADAVVKACSDPETQHWLDFLPRPYGLDDALTFIGNGRADWESGRAAVFAIGDATTGGLLGAIAVQEISEGRPFVGYWVGPWARGRGVATRAARLVGRWAIRGLGLPRLELQAEPGNIGSLRVAERAGFVREGVLRNYLDGREGRTDCVVFSLVPGDLERE